MTPDFNGHDGSASHLATSNSSDPVRRIEAGRVVGKAHFKKILSQLAKDPKTGKIIEKIQIYTHSRGAAFGAGYTESLIAMIKENANLFEDAANEIDFIYNMAPHQSGDVTSPAGVNGYSHSHDRDRFSGNNMGGVKSALSSDEKSKGILGAHANSSFTKNVGTFLKAFQSSKGDPAKLTEDFVKKMKKDYGINVTVL